MRRWDCARSSAHPEKTHGRRSTPREPELWGTGELPQFEDKSLASRNNVRQYTHGLFGERLSTGQDEQGTLPDRPARLVAVRMYAMNNLISLAGTACLLVTVPVGHGADPVSTVVPIRTNATANIGVGFRNVYATASKEQAQAKIARFRKAATPVTFQEFLGQPVSSISIVSCHGDPGQAAELVRGLLDSVIVRPGNRGGPTLEGPRWAEVTPITVTAFLQYGNGRGGVLESDGTHLFFQDGDGTCWWHRWDAMFPRELRQPGGAAGQDPPVAPKTDRTAPTPGSAR